MAMACAAAYADEPPPSAGTGEDADLARRLIRKARTGSDEDVMENLIRLMDEAARNLELEFAAGEETQALQCRILDQLDDAIKQAASQRRRRPGGRPVFTGDKRRRPADGKRRADKATEAQNGWSGVSDSNTVDTAVGSPSADSSGDALLESRRSWGHLPQREREEVIQGIDERFLERYREWIELYYRALQESGN